MRTCSDKSEPAFSLQKSACDSLIILYDSMTTLLHEFEMLNLNYVTAELFHRRDWICDHYYRLLPEHLLQCDNGMGILLFLRVIHGHRSVESL